MASKDDLKGHDPAGEDALAAEQAKAEAEKSQPVVEKVTPAKGDGTK